MKSAFVLIVAPPQVSPMLDLAKTLDESGRFAPSLVFWSPREFENNTKKCRESPYRSFVWRGSAFWSKERYVALKAQGQSGESMLSQPWGSFAVSTRLSVLFGRVFPQSWIVLCTYVRILAQAFRDMILSYTSDSSPKRSFLAYSSLALAKHDWDCCLQSPDFEGRQASFRLWAIHLGLFSVGSDIAQWHKNYFQEIHFQRIMHVRFLELLKAERPSIVIIPEESMYFGPIVVDAAHRSQIRCAVVPYTLASIQEMVWGHLNAGWNQIDQGIMSLINRAFPQWTVKAEGRRLAVYSPYIFLCEILSAYPLLWRYYGGHADALAAESTFMVEHYLRWGIPPEKIEKTGSLTDDAIFHDLSARDKKRATLLASCGVSNARKVVLMALPENLFRAWRPEWEFSDHLALCRFMTETLLAKCSPQDTILINLHPRLDPESVPWAYELGAHVVDLPIEQLIPLTDIFVAVISATIRVAVASGVPVVNFDTFQFDWDDYKALPGVCHARTRIEFEKTVDKLLNDDDFFALQKALQQKSAQRLYRLHGNARLRLVALLDRLSERMTSP